MTSTTMDDITPWPDRNDPTQRFGLLFRRRKSTKVVADLSLEPTQAEMEVGFEKVGNVTRSDDSLLVRKARAARYSKKFRDSVIDRILTGEASLTQVRNELKLTERDILDWINDRVMRQDRRIEKLTQVVDTVKQLTNDPSVTAAFHEQAQLKLHAEESTAEGDLEAMRHNGATIEGRVQRG